MSGRWNHINNLESYQQDRKSQAASKWSCSRWGSFRLYGMLSLCMSEQMSQAQVSQLPLQTLEQFVFPLTKSFTAHSSNVHSSPAAYPRGDACSNHFCYLPWLLDSATDSSSGFQNLYPSHSTCFPGFLVTIPCSLSPSLLTLLYPHVQFSGLCLAPWVSSWSCTVFPLAVHLSCIINSPF